MKSGLRWMPWFSVAFVLIALMWPVPLVAQESGGAEDRIPQWGGPDAVENLLRNDAAVDRPTSTPTPPTPGRP